MLFNLPIRALQVGGLYPGVKCTASLPTRPLQLVVDSLPLLPAVKEALEKRLVLVFVGQVRGCCMRRRLRDVAFCPFRGAIPFS